MSDTSAKQKAKGTKVTENIIGAASNKMVSATKALTDAVTTALKLASTVDEQALKIADNEEKLNGLEQDYQNKKSQQSIDLDLDYKADQKRFAERYLTECGLTSVSAQEYQALQAKCKEWETSFTDKLREETGKAYGQAQKDATTTKQLAEAEYKAKEAGNLAQIENLKSQLEFANRQAADWKQQLESEREAGVKRAQASAIGNVNVTGGGK